MIAAAGAVGGIGIHILRKLGRIEVNQEQIEALRREDNRLSNEIIKLDGELQTHIRRSQDASIEREAKASERRKDLYDRIEHVERHTDQRFHEVDQRFDQISREVGENSVKLDYIANTMDRIEKRLKD